MNHDRRKAIHLCSQNPLNLSTRKRHIFELECDGTSCIVFIGKGKVVLQERRLLNKLYPLAI